MKILTKAQLEKAKIESLFKPVEGKTLACLEKIRLDRGKYKPGTMAGRDVPEHMQQKYLAIWTERRRDSDGPYDALFCYPKR